MSYWISVAQVQHAGGKKRVTVSLLRAEQVSCVSVQRSNHDLISSKAFGESDRCSSNTGGRGSVPARYTSCDSKSRRGLSIYLVALSTVFYELPQARLAPHHHMTFHDENDERLLGE
jgi:hypothetical protein